MPVLAKPSLSAISPFRGMPIRCSANTGYRARRGNTAGASSAMIGYVRSSRVSEIDLPTDAASRARPREGKVKASLRACASARCVLALTLRRFPRLNCWVLQQSATENPMGNKKKKCSTDGTRGFANMSGDRHKEISSIGGRSAHARGHAHTFTSDEARQAGQRGGSAVSADRAHMSAIGRIGGKRSRNKQEDSNSPA